MTDLPPFAFAHRHVAVLQGVLDWILIEGGRMEAVAAAPYPPAAALPPMPNEEFVSDHVALCVELRLKPMT